MKILRVRANNFKNCADNFTIDFVAKSRKTSEDKEYELEELAENLHVFNTAAFVGKNASGKTTAVELLDCCYSILGDFCVEGKHYSYDGIELEIIFFHEGFIYRYKTSLNADPTFGNRATFVNQVLERKVYLKSYHKTIYDDDRFESVPILGELPEDTSIVFFVLKKKATRAVYFDCDGRGIETYQLMFKAFKKYNISAAVLSSILKVFDSNISDLSMVDEHNFRLILKDQPEATLSDKELIHFLSSGTTKGILLYTFIVAALQNGFDLIIDEVENHFHKTLVENMLSLFKDKSVNKNGATLVFTTHYCEVLDLFGRQDNIWIAKSDGKVSLTNMKDYEIRSELLKSRQFYNNTFQTAVNYEDLMELKKVLMRK